MKTIQKGDKLYIVTREDISPGLQAVQSCHALRQFVAENPMIDEMWYKNSNYIVLLSVKNEDELLMLLQDCRTLHIAVSHYAEPDLDNAVTAIAIAPSQIARILCKNIPLALR